MVVIELPTISRIGYLEIKDSGKKYIYMYSTLDEMFVIDEDGKVLDLGVQDNDHNDTIDYSLTERWNDITKNIQREV